MTRPSRPNPVRVQYAHDEMFRMLRGYGIGAARADMILDAYERSREIGKDAPCQSVVHHGPGHQSSTYCQVTGGEVNHDVIDGKITHFADLPSGGQAEWTDDRPYVEYWG